MANYELTVETRATAKKSARDARDAGFVPGVVYGYNTDSFAISAPRSALLKMYRKAGHSSLVELAVDGKKLPVIIHQLDLHPVTSEMHHVDFLVVNLKKPVSVHIPVYTTGESIAVKNLGGLLTINTQELTIRCLPKDIPHDITVDISGLKNIHDSVLLKDLNLDPKKFEVMHIDENTPICSIMGHSTKDEDADSSAAATEEEAAAE